MTIEVTKRLTLIGVTVDFTANITDDRGNSLTATNQVNVSHRGGPRVEIPQ